MAKRATTIILLLALASFGLLEADAGIFCPETSVSYGGEEFIEDCRQLADLNVLSYPESALSRQILSLPGVDIPIESLVVEIPVPAERLVEFQKVKFGQERGKGIAEWEASIVCLPAVGDDW